MRALFWSRSERFFRFGRKTHRTVQQYMHIDPFVGVGAIGRWFGDLKERAFKGDGVVLSDGAFLFKAQGFFDLGGAGFSPSGL